jgi:hypothetical protein
MTLKSAPPRTIKLDFATGPPPLGQRKRHASRRA